MLHSLDLAQRGTGPLGEADFVVIAPGFGVMVIEAKTYLARTAEGEWLTHPHGPPKERSPFQQANAAIYRIKEWVRTHGLPDVLAAAVVIVPDMEYRPHTTRSSGRLGSSSTGRAIVQEPRAADRRVFRGAGCRTSSTRRRRSRASRPSASCECCAARSSAT